MRKQDLKELNKTLPKATDVVKYIKHARLRNYKTFGEKVTIQWDISPETVGRGLFKIKVGDKEAMLSAEEVLHYVRFV